MFTLQLNQKLRRILAHQNFVENSTCKMDFPTIEITSKKVRGNNVDFSSIEITSKKVPRNNADFSTSEIKSKKCVEMTWKFVVIWSSTYRRNIDVDLTWCARCDTGSKSRGVFKSFSNIYGETLSQVCLYTIYLCTLFILCTCSLNESFLSVNT